ncbi:P-loop containing nucleoside triphosphate hydrolase protein, partial [Polyplosphaeria fusca]
GWWGWLRQFQTFLPHLIPFKDRRLQVYAICLVGLVLLSRALNLIGPKLLGDVVNKVVTLEDHGSIPWTPILEYIFLAKVPQELIVEPLKSILRNRLHYWAYKELLMASYSHIMGLSLDFHDNKESAEAYAAVDQSNRLNQLLDNLIMTAFPIVLDHVLILAYLSYLFDVYMGLILAVIFVAYTISTYKLTAICAPHQRECLQYTREQKKIQIESFSAWQEAAYINRQSYHIEQLHIATAKEIKHMAMFTDLSLIQQIGQNSIMILGYTAVLILAVYQIVHKNRPIGTFVALLMYWSQLTRPIYQLAFAYKDIVGYAVEAEPLLRIMQTAPTVVDSAGAPNLTPRGGKVEFSRVSFTYDTRQDFIKDLSFTVVAGSTVAFVGQTGAGKTTICNKLLFRFYDVTGGSIQIDGQDIRDVTQHSLRETIGIVPQDPVFLSTTVLEAVRYARLNATDEEVYNACKAAAIHDSILRKPCGYQHQIGDRGCKLSGGEKQRLAIARVFLRDPEIIVLDEATSTVDNLSEAKIQQALSNVCRGKTTFVIAHRLSTVMHADQIFVLDQGRIAERGTHDELLQLKGRYWQLWYKKV